MAVLDEADMSTGGGNVYQLVLTPMLGKEFQLNQAPVHLKKVLWVFIVSGSEDLERFREHASRCVSGPDFLRRFETAGAMIEVPGIEDFVDAILQVVVTAKAVKPTIDTAEAAFLYYFAANRWRHCGELKGAVERAVAYMPEEATTLRYRLLPKDVEFVAQHHDAIDALEHHQIRFL